MNNTNKQPDDLNPKYLFSTIHTDLLVQAISNKIDLQSLVKKELANRGLNEKGLWVGFDKAKQIHGVN
jgi:predicted DNA-binding transcriptional regulator